MTKTINKSDYKDISIRHLQFCLSNTDLFTGEQFSIIQYSNPSILNKHFNLSRKIYNCIAQTPRQNTYLNMGMGCGFLEYYVKNYGKINLESVEWVNQNKQFLIMRNLLNVDDQVTYICNDIRSDDFKIFNCSKKYDFIILTRFYPINSTFSPNVDSVKKILIKLKIYSDKIILIDSYIKYNNEVSKFFNSIHLNELSNKNKLEYWILDLKKVL
jgi:hypothetical protein